MIGYAQKKKNGTIFNEHPAISTVESMNEAFVKGDADKVASLLADDFKSFNGSNPNKDAKGGTKDNFVKRVEFWNKNIAYLSIERTKGAYPDAIEYKDEDQKDYTWVQTWTHVKGVHNTTGVKLDMPFHHLYRVNSENKISLMIEYYDERVYQEVGQSFVERKNGTLYKHHEYINSVRRLIHAWEFGDEETYFSFFDKDAQFRSIHDNIGDFETLDEAKEGFNSFRENYEVKSADIRGYPDYLHYEQGNSKVVQSWWTVRLIRKSDKKELVIPVFLIHDFNDDGKITDETVYFSAKRFEAK